MKPTLTCHCAVTTASTLAGHKSVQSDLVQHYCCKHHYRFLIAKTLDKSFFIFHIHALWLLSNIINVTLYGCWHVSMQAQADLTVTSWNDNLNWFLPWTGWSQYTRIFTAGKTKGWHWCKKMKSEKCVFSGWELNHQRLI